MMKKMRCERDKGVKKLKVFFTASGRSGWIL